MQLNVLAILIGTRRHFQLRSPRIAQVLSCPDTIMASTVASIMAVSACCELLQTALRSRCVPYQWPSFPARWQLTERNNRPRELQRLMPCIALSTRTLLRFILGEVSRSNEALRRTSPLWTAAAELGSVYLFMAADNTVCLTELPSSRV